eukprot:scpid85926/ scgid31556/ 
MPRPQLTMARQATPNPVVSTTGRSSNEPVRNAADPMANSTMPAATSVLDALLLQIQLSFSIASQLMFPRLLVWLLCSQEMRMLRTFTASKNNEHLADVPNSGTCMYFLNHLHCPPAGSSTSTVIKVAFQCIKAPQTIDWHKNSLLGK